MKVAKNHLTARQNQFCAFYAGEAKHNSALAARLAGYAAASSHVTGCKLLQIPKIAAVVRGLEDVAAKEMGMTRQRVINELVGAFDMAKLMENPATMVASMRLIALMSGYFQKQDSVSIKVGIDGQTVMSKFERMTDAELLAVIACGGGEPKAPLA